MKILKSQSAFTLVEAIIYLAIVGIVITAAVDFVITMGNSASKMSANIEASRNRRYALTTINYLARNADGLWKDINGDCSNFNVSPPILALYFDNDNYLPGNCVEKGGGVKITVVNNRVLMTCYPNIYYNGSYNACAAAASSTYYLTGPEVIVTNSNLSFSTSTASTTANSYNVVTTHLKVTTPSANQKSLLASSEATSTADMRNEQPNGLISWWKFEDADPSVETDSVSGYDFSCDGLEIVPGLISGSSNAVKFILGEGDICTNSNPEKLNFNNSFSISVWLMQDTDIETTHSIFFKQNGTKGYHLYTFESNGDIYFDMCNGTSCTQLLSAMGQITRKEVFNVTVVYDKDLDTATMYIYQKAVGGVSTTTASNLPFLVNDNTIKYPQISDIVDGNEFDGVIDDMRVYNRALSNTEVWALQSQGAQ